MAAAVAANPGPAGAGRWQGAGSFAEALRPFDPARLRGRRGRHVDGLRNCLPAQGAGRRVRDVVPLRGQATALPVS